MTESKHENDRGALTNQPPPILPPLKPSDYSSARKRDNAQRSRWASNQVGHEYQGQRIYGWTLDGAPRGGVRLFTNPGCTEHIDVAGISDSPSQPAREPTGILGTDVFKEALDMFVSVSPSFSLRRTLVNSHEALRAERDEWRRKFGRASFERNEVEEALARAEERLAEMEKVRLDLHETTLEWLEDQGYNDQDAAEIVTDLQLRARALPSRKDTDKDPEKHECMRCGSDEWEDINYSGCSVCRDDTGTETAE